MKLAFRGKIANHQFVPNSEPFYRHHLGKFEGKEGLMTFDPKKRHRSPNQNAWYWGMIIPMIAEAMGEHDEDYIHALLKTKFLSKRVVIDGEVLRVAGSTAKLNTSQFGIYCEKIRAWAATNLNINIPDPDPNGRDIAVFLDD